MNPAAPTPPRPPGPMPQALWRSALFALCVAAACAAIWLQHGSQMALAGHALLLGLAALLVALGHHWPGLQGLALAVALLALPAMALLRSDDPLLHQLASNQRHVAGMCLLLGLATLLHWLALWARRASAALQRWGSRLAWGGCALGMSASLLRWHESHGLGPGMGHLPIGNLYDVLLLFCWLTTALYLYGESRYGSLRQLGALALSLVCAAAGLLLWHGAAHQGHAIGPLVPALQSHWMALHVPANFVGYGCFTLAAALAFAWLLKHHAQQQRPSRAAQGLLWLLGMALCLVPVLLGSMRSMHFGQPHFWLLCLGLAVVPASAIMALRGPVAQRLPSLALLDALLYQSIALGFAFFTLATVLGAIWADQAWGRYWSWDPKETWALIVWLNYASWLHSRMLKGWRGPWLAWWALLSLALTGFAFLGVNLLMGGLHSYGRL
ncbi:MAG: c-type cytochrome biogenesis protein CcsB [Comamonadaceae bacterium]|nr:c-type cytochrome biogenesis protein CcsB [Comamonadaceae bacterium]